MLSYIARCEHRRVLCLRRGPAQSVRPVLVFALLACIALTSVPTAMAQRAKIYSTTISGKIEEVGRGLLKVKSARRGDEVWVIRPEGVSNYRATAPKEWLQPGMIVMVTSRFDKKGKAADSVSSVQVFTPRPGRTVGITADPSDPGDPDDKTAPRTYILAGAIKSIEDGNLTIAAGRKAFVIPMAEKVEVSIDLINDMNWVKAGDEFTGKVKFQVKGQALGSEMKIVSKEPLAPPEAAPLSKRERLAKIRREKAAKQRGEKEAKAADATLPKSNE